MAEYVDWIAYFSVDWDKFKPAQSSDQMQNNLKMIMAAKPKKIKKK